MYITASHLLFMKYRLFTGVFLFSLLYYSCQKNDFKDPDKEFIVLAKEQFRTLASRHLIQYSKLSVRVVWEKAAVKSFDFGKGIVVPLDYGNESYVIDKKNNNEKFLLEVF